jgi:aerobic carbon-monoxide dehydrogenase medium subunit
MIPVAFDYKKAKTVDEAIAALAGGNGKVLAGGHSLIPAMKLRLNQPEVLVDIAAIASLKGITEANGEIVIGAATTHAEIAANKTIQTKLPVYSQAANMIGDIQVRNKGTLGGSLAHADPAADWTAVVMATDAVIAVQGSKGTRKIKATEFFNGLFSTTLGDGEIITAIHVPIPANGSKMTYEKFVQPASRFAIVGCAAVKHADGKIAIAFTGVSDTPFRDAAAEKAAGAALNAASIEAAGNASAEGVSIMSDHYASEKYRKHLAKVYCKKALQAIA